MSGFEVQEPILNSPYEEPREHWRIVEGEEPQRAPGRRPAMYFYRPPGPAVEGGTMGAPIELKLVNRIRMQLDQWRPLALKGEGGVTRTTMELMNYWRREGRGFKLFFAQLETAETIIFLSEARSDFLQGIQIPLDEPGPHQQADGIKPLLRYGAKMATGSGKTTVMGMLAAWSILNKAANRSDSRFSDVAIVVCPNLTIKNRLRELDPSGGEASIYRTRDLIPPHAMTVLSQGKVLVTNWHIFERQAIQQGGVPARVSKVGVPLRTTEMITIGAKTTTARGARYLTENDLRRQVDLGLIKVLEEDRDDKKSLRKVKIESLRYVESDAKWVERVLGREIGNKQNLFVINDEAHHAYRIRAEADEDQLNLFEEEDDDEFEAEFVREATVWVEGLDRINRLRGVNFCADFSATPFFLARKGPDANRPFPWVVSEFGLTDAIESGLTKIPQLAVRDSSGAEIPGFFNVWQWIAKVVYEWLALDEWEQAAAYFIDTHPAVDAFVKNEGLGFAIPYLHKAKGSKNFGRLIISIIIAIYFGIKERGAYLTALSPDAGVAELIDALRKAGPRLPLAIRKRIIELAPVEALKGLLTEDRQTWGDTWAVRLMGHIGAKEFAPEIVRTLSASDSLSYIYSDAIDAIHALDESTDEFLLNAIRDNAIDDWASFAVLEQLPYSEAYELAVHRWSDEGNESEDKMDSDELFAGCLRQIGDSRGIEKLQGIYADENDATYIGDALDCLGALHQVDIPEMPDILRKRKEHQESHRDGMKLWNNLAYDLSALEAPETVKTAGNGVPFTRSAPKAGRNQPCPCGSGRKYKKCCLKQNDQQR